MVHDVVIIGGGITGCAIARELGRYRLDVAMVEKECEVGFGTTKSNSGIIHAGHHGDPGTLKGRLEWQGNQAWDGLHEELDFGFERVGELMVAFEEDQVRVLEEMKARGREKGVPGLEIWDRERIAAEEPNLSGDIIAALHAPTAGVVNPYEACFTLLDNARANGLKVFVDTTVTGISTDHGRLVVETANGPLAARFVVNAAGLFADQVAAMAGAGDFTIRPRKGEEYLLDKRLKGLVKRIIFPCPTPVSKGILVIPTFDGTIMVGPTALDVDDKEDLSTSIEGSDEVFASVKRMVPGISEHDCIAEFAGLRAPAGGGDFIIGPAGLKGFINVAGIQSPGLTAAPAIASMVADILAGEGLGLDHDDSFQPAVDKRISFADISDGERVRLAAGDQGWGTIGCRCELVSEREIVEAIRAGARTLDGVKFRTRAGMGRCQGGFCTWRCMTLLSRELGLPITSITKRGGDSWIVRRRGDLTVNRP
ncbi:MAG: NAD(P)/FAD-dependent oxidoreductase [Rhodospirillales bacterium]